MNFLRHYIKSNRKCRRNIIDLHINEARPIMLASLVFSTVRHGPVLVPAVVMHRLIVVSVGIAHPLSVVGETIVVHHLLVSEWHTSHLHVLKPHLTLGIESISKHLTILKKVQPCSITSVSYYLQHVRQTQIISYSDLILACFRSHVHVAFLELFEFCKVWNDIVSFV